MFLDASALAKAYLAEDGSSNVRGVIARADGDLYLSDFVALEVLTSLRAAFRGLGARVHDSAVRSFYADFPLRFTVMDVDAGIRKEAMVLTTRSRSARARSMDVLHIATAMQLQREQGPVTMVTSDRDLADLARECGLRTFDPSREPLAALPRVPR
ncbi:MAG TPA: type II toxin-antitoxin system VapC family toxin [Longimicrobium sp.]|uniref:type II toxin-antitoxin system VapC family toxin n=1 Tax=Longimicrobium sp. TaxID=2029185 RepID=UPI002EDB6286